MTKFENSFIDEEDMKDCLDRGCEVEFVYDKKKYSITHSEGNICICEFYNEASEMIYPDASKALAYDINGKKLKDIICEMKILFRSF